MEAIELYREETAKMKEHRAICRAAGKEVSCPSSYVLGNLYKKNTEGGHFQLNLDKDMW